jgi:3',5'-cyclic-AMP phosphodiesterase
VLAQVAENAGDQVFKLVAAAKDFSAGERAAGEVGLERLDEAADGIDRRNFLSCMAWAGTGLLWTMAGGVPTSKLFAATGRGRRRGRGAGSGFSFVQISDSHIGFNKAANQDVTGTLKLALDKINALPGDAGSAAAHRRHHALVEAGGVRHGAAAHQGVKAGETFYVPGEHDIATDDGAMYLERFGKGTQGRGWYSFNHKGVHFIGLNNCQQVDAMGSSAPIN